MRREKGEGDKKKRKLLLTSSAFPNFFWGKGIQINEGFS